MRPHPRTLAGLSAAAALLLAGCTTPTPNPSTTPNTPSASISTPASATPTPSATSTLTAEQQKAVKDATAAVMAYRQIGVDLYSGARTRVDDLNDVTTGEFHDESVRQISISLAKGDRVQPKGAQLVLVSSEPVEVDLDKKKPTVVVRVCIDGSAATSVDASGLRTPGARDELVYTVVYTTNRSNPVWAVSRAQGAANPEERKC